MKMSAVLKAAALWDLRIEDGDGTAIDFAKLNLLEIGKVTLRYNAETRKATAKCE